MKRIRLTKREINVLLEAAGNVDPCMFKDGSVPDKEADRDVDAWHSGRDKLEAMLARREQK